MREKFKKIFKSILTLFSFCCCFSSKRGDPVAEIIKNEFKLKIKNPNNIEVYEKAV